MKNFIKKYFRIIFIVILLISLVVILIHGFKPYYSEWNDSIVISYTTDEQRDLIKNNFTIASSDERNNLITLQKISKEEFDNKLKEINQDSLKDLEISTTRKAGFGSLIVSILLANLTFIAGLLVGIYFFINKNISKLKQILGLALFTNITAFAVIYSLILIVSRIYLVKSIDLIVLFIASVSISALILRFEYLNKTLSKLTLKEFISKEAKLYAFPILLFLLGSVFFTGVGYFISISLILSGLLISLTTLYAYEDIQHFIEKRNAKAVSTTEVVKEKKKVKKQNFYSKRSTKKANRKK